MPDKKTTMLKRREQMMHKPLEQCHGGVGAIDWVNVLGREDLQGRVLNFLHDDILQPGDSIGFHEHTDDEEYYYIVSGTGTMRLDDECVEVNAGDIAAVFPGGRHALENTGDEAMRFIVISVINL